MKINIFKKPKKLIPGLLAGLVSSLSMSVMAASLPTSAVTSSDGNYFTVIQKIVGSAYEMVSQSFSLFAFFIMAAIAIWKYTQVHSQKATWFDFAVSMAIGALVLIVVFFFLNQGSTYNTTTM